MTSQKTWRVDRWPPLAWLETLIKLVGMLFGFVWSFLYGFIFGILVGLFYNGLLRSATETECYDVYG